VLLWSLMALLPAGRVRPAGPAQIR
jgi:hypothetical protein